MRQVEGPWKGAVSAQKALRGSVMETRELLGGTEENCVSLTIWLSDPPQYMIAWALPVLKLLFCSVPGYTTVSKSTCVRHTHSSAEAAEMTTLQEISYFHLKDTMQLGQSQLSSPLSQVKWWPFLWGLLRPRNESLLFAFSQNVFSWLSQQQHHITCVMNYSNYMVKLPVLTFCDGVFVNIFVVPLQLKTAIITRPCECAIPGLGSRLGTWSAGLLDVVPWGGPWTVWIFSWKLSFCP